MADELIENVEYSKKKKDEEEPILVAQRHLNIFHQIHIFNQARKDQFDQMLLDLPDEIRVLFSTLPGGSLLQEHIEELELKRGMMNENELEESSEKRKKDARDLLAKTTKQSGGDAKTIGLDPSFATTLASSLGKALQQSDQRHRDDIQALTKSMAESQANMLAMVRELLASQAQEKHAEADRQVQDIELNNADVKQKPSKKQRKFLEKLLKTKEQESVSVPEPVVVSEPEPVVAPEPEPEPVVMPEPVVAPAPEPEPVVAPEPMEDFSFTESVNTESMPSSEQKDSPLPPEIEQIRQALTKPEEKSQQEASEQTAPLDLPKELATTSDKEDTFSLDDLDITPVSLDDDLEPTISSQDVPQAGPQAQTSATSDDDWEWAYVEDDDKTNEEGDDWEWAYVEDDSPDQNTPQENQ